ncbi:hypothetical protein E0K83_07580 [Gramella sp. BOM4]|nr:hypothetical protein [Christiangramia bathymodioli]
MQEQQEYIITTREDLSQIEVVRKMVEDIHLSGNFFNLSLKTLELIKRFNELHARFHEDNKESAALMNQLVVCSLNLEKQLIQEN